MTEPIDLLKLARDMRKAQKEYYRLRTQTALNKAKQIEKQFDKELEAFFNPSKQLCFEDFNTQPAPWLDIPLEPLK